MTLRLGMYPQAELARLRGRDRPDGDTRRFDAERRERTGRRGGREHDEVGLREALGSELEGPVHGDEVGAELLHDYAAGALRRREQHPAGGARELRRKPFLGRDLRDELGLDPPLPQRLGGSAANGGDFRQTPLEAREERVDRVAAREDDPVVAVRAQRRPRQGLDRHERAGFDLEALFLERCSERSRQGVRRREDDLHARSDAVAARSSSASASGSSPVRRSTHAPSSSAISAVSTPPSWCAAMGARQPPPILATHARSASTRRRVSASSAAPTSSSSPARTWSATAPWPASGSSSSGEKR